MEATKRILLLMGVLFLFACGGSDSDPDPASVAEDNGANDPQGLPNFTVIDFVAPSVIEDGAHNGKYSFFQYEITIQNTGVGPGRPDLVWVLSSARSDFSTGYRFTQDKLIRIGEHESIYLMPGETGVYRSHKTSLSLGVKGNHYVKIWVNPDKGENFDTSEDRVMSERETEESDYFDNFSEIAVIHAPNGGANHCTEIPDEENNHLVEDNLEENDSLETAFPIDLGTKYEATLCLDHRDVYKVNLVAGANYTIEVSAPFISGDC
ncbi:MAG: hypothetical protein DSZ28_03150 [Thiothrix sp.]|nr:MAG: hypothetical protein DSZ28_03150 [Thiothrix sp.]